MRSVSIGTPAASSSRRSDCGEKRAGFTLIEALVAMALVLAFVATLGSYLFHAQLWTSASAGWRRRFFCVQSLLRRSIVPNWQTRRAAVNSTAFTGELSRRRSQLMQQPPEPDRGRPTASPQA